MRVVVAVLALTGWMSVMRLVRADVARIRSHAFIEGATALGVPDWRVLWRHVLPNALGSTVVATTLGVGNAILLESGLSFLGLGIQPPAPSWGNMLGGVLAASFKPSWWLVVFPGLAITLAVMSANLLGDALRDFLDPKLRQRLE